MLTGKFDETWSCASFSSAGPLCKSMTSSTKLEVYNILYCHQRRTKTRPETLPKFGHDVFEICEWTDRQTWRLQYFAHLLEAKLSLKFFLLVDVTVELKMTVPLSIMCIKQPLYNHCYHYRTVRTNNFNFSPSKWILSVVMMPLITTIFICQDNNNNRNNNNNNCHHDQECVAVEKFHWLGWRRLAVRCLSNLCSISSSSFGV